LQEKGALGIVGHGKVSRVDLDVASRLMEITQGMNEESLFAMPKKKRRGEKGGRSLNANLENFTGIRRLGRQLVNEAVSQKEQNPLNPLSTGEKKAS